MSGLPDPAGVDRDALVESVGALGRFAAGITWGEQNGATQEAVRRVLRDSLAVMVAGGRLPESRRLRRALPRSAGPATVLGDHVGWGVTDAAWCNGLSLVSLELDEGNKSVRGHATAHVLPAVLAMAEADHADGDRFAAAFLAGHEVASRFGRATVLRPGVHPHGNWGVAGAAAAAARMAGLPAASVGRAIDIAGALALATPFSVATSGLAVRNAWIGSANVAGIQAAALAGGEEPVTGVAAESLGWLLGTIDPTALAAEPREPMAVTGGYFKRHASCSYTHPPADAALALRSAHGPVAPGDVARVDVATHHLAAHLSAQDWPTRLAAMFSIPYVVAVALRDGDCSPARFTARRRADPGLAALAARVHVAEDPLLDARLPGNRAARLRVEWTSGAVDEVEVPNPVGDADYQPLSDADLQDKATALLDSRDQAEELWSLSDALIESPDVSVELGHLRRLAAAGDPGRDL